MASIKQGNPIKNFVQYCWEYTDSYLDTWPKKIFFALVFVITQLFIFYATAVFDVGIYPNFEISISGLYRLYQIPGTKYPWGTFCVLSLCIDFVSVLYIWKNGTPPGGRNFKLSKSNTYGSGREISKRELAEVTNIGHKDSMLGTILGQLDVHGKQAIASKAGKMPNDNMLVFGPPGSGKSTSYVLTYIAQAILRRHSICVSDTKGEVYSKTAELARRHGYRVLRLDLKNPACSDGWNVLKELRHDDVRALIFAKTVMANTNSEGGKDIHAAPEESLLKACCLYQERVPFLADSQRTFYNAFSLLLQSAEELDDVFMSAFSAHGDCMQVVMDSYATFLQGSPNLRGNIITGLANRLQVLASPPVREMTSTDEIDFASLGKQPTILYISMSDQHQTMSFLASLAFSFAFLDLVDLADHNPGQRLKVPVHFLMEEFGNLGYIPNIDKYLSTARSRGISINLVVQSLAQLESVYEESMTDIILADCATWMCLGCNDKRTAELLEWRSGEATIQVKTLQHDAMEPPGKFTHQHSSGDGRRNFYTSNDIMKIKARKEAFIVWQQLDSLKCRAFPIFQHKEFQKGRMPEISADSLIPLSNKRAKLIFRQWEEVRIKAFRAWMAAGGDPLKDYKMHANTTGEEKSSDLPDIIPIHTLERMALAKAAGREYDPTTDPDSPKYIPPKDEDDVIGEDEEYVLDLSGLVFEQVEPIPEEKEKPKKSPKPRKPKNVEDDTPRPVTTPELNGELHQPALTENPPIASANTVAAQGVSEQVAETEAPQQQAETTPKPVAEEPQGQQDNAAQQAPVEVAPANNAAASDPVPVVAAKEEAVSDVKPATKVKQSPQAEKTKEAAPQKTPMQKQAEKYFDEKEQRKAAHDALFGPSSHRLPNKRKDEIVTTALESGSHKKLSMSQACNNTAKEKEGE